MKPFECNGLWWTPDDPSSRVAGTLRFSHEKGVVLSLLGTLGEPGGLVGVKKQPILLGSAYDSPFGQAITLRGCWLKGHRVGVPGFNRDEYHADRAFFGAHLVGPDDFLFSSCVISISGLANWAYHLSGFQLEVGRPGSRDQVWYTLRYKPPAALGAEVAAGQVSLYFGAGYSLTRRDYSFKEEAAFAVSVTSPLAEEDWYGRYVSPLLNFVTFATDAPNALERLELHRGNGTPHLSVRVVAPRVYAEAGEEGNPAPHKMLFSLEDLGEVNFAATLSRWFEVFARYYDACDLFFAIRYAPGTYVDIRLLTLMQCLELYERKRTATDPARASLPADLLSGLPEGVQSQLTKWLGQQKVDTFESALAALFDEHRAVLGPLVSADRAAFLSEALTIRNHVLHRTPAVDQLGDYGLRLYLLADTLAFLMKACLLKELGFSEEQRLAIFQRHQLYIFIQGEYEKQRRGR